MSGVDGGSPDRKRSRPQLGLMLVGKELVAAVLGCTLLGLWIDRRYGSEPWGVLIGVLVGTVGGLANLVREARRAMRRESREE